MMILYLFMFAPMYAAVLIHLDCLKWSKCGDLHFYAVLFSNLTWFGHVLFAYGWFFADKEIRKKAALVMEKLHKIWKARGE